MVNGAQVTSGGLQIVMATGSASYFSLAVGSGVGSHALVPGARVTSSNASVCGATFAASVRSALDVDLPVHAVHEVWGTAIDLGRTTL